VCPSFDGANSAALAAFPRFNLVPSPFNNLALVVYPRAGRRPRSLDCGLFPHLSRVPQATHGSQGRPQRSIWGVSIVLGSPRRLDAPPFSRSSYDRLTFCLYFWSVVRIFSWLLTFNTTPRLPLVPSHPMRARAPMGVCTAAHNNLCLPSRVFVRGARSFSFYYVDA
jgi:hypothetical protein